MHAEAHVALREDHLPILQRQRDFLFDRVSLWRQWRSNHATILVLQFGRERLMAFIFFRLPQTVAVHQIGHPRRGEGDSLAGLSVAIDIDVARTWLQPEFQTTDADIRIRRVVSHPAQLVQIDARAAAMATAEIVVAVMSHLRNCIRRNVFRKSKPSMVLPDERHVADGGKQVDQPAVFAKAFGLRPAGRRIDAFVRQKHTPETMPRQPRQCIVRTDRRSRPQERAVHLVAKTSRLPVGYDGVILQERNVFRARIRRHRVVP